MKNDQTTQAVALVINTLSGGGAEKNVANLSRALSGQYEIDIIVNDRCHLTYPYEGHIVSLEMPAEQPRMDTSYQVRLLLKRTSVLRYLKKKKQYAAVISFSEMSNLANVLSGNRHGKTIVSVRISVLKGKDRSRQHRLLSPFVLPWCYKTADKTVCCSKGIADELEECYGLKREKSAVIFNGLELPLIRKKALEELSAAEIKDWENRKLIVTVGRLDGQKGQWHLLRAVKKLIGDGIPIHLLILGEGELREALEREAARLKIANAVTFAGFVENPYKYMAHADAVVMPSLYEGFSNVMIEALALGVPVISTDHETGAREILAPDTDHRVKVKDRIDEAAYGILVPVCEGAIGENSHNDTVQESFMAEAIRRILTDGDLAKRYREAALRRAEQMDIRSVCRQWIRLIEEGC